MSSEGGRICIKVFVVVLMTCFQWTNGCIRNDDCRFRSLVIQNRTIKIYKERCCLFGSYSQTCIKVAEFGEKCRVNLGRQTTSPWIYRTFPSWNHRPQRTVDPYWWADPVIPTFTSTPTFYNSGEDEGGSRKGGMAAFILLLWLIFIPIYMFFRCFKSRRQAQEISHAISNEDENRHHVDVERGGVISLTVSTGGGMTNNQPPPYEDSDSGPIHQPSPVTLSASNLNELLPPPPYENIDLTPPPKYEDVV